MPIEYNLQSYIIGCAYIVNSGSISNIHISPYDDFAEGEQSLEWKYESQTVANSYNPAQWDQVGKDY